MSSLLAVPPPWEGQGSAVLSLTRERGAGPPDEWQREASRTRGRPWPPPDTARSTPSASWVTMLRDSSSRTSIALDVEELLDSLRTDGVVIEGVGAVENYLLCFSDVIDVVRKAVSAARRHFPDGQLIMSVYNDPEIDDRYLALEVRAKGDSDSLFARLEKAQAEFVDDLAHKEGWVQLVTDFREPDEADVL
jgi:hypothetical protein